MAVRAQEPPYLQGVCVNEKGRAVENVSVYCHDTILVSITDEQGCFAFKNAKAGDKIRFAHMGYEPKEYTVKDEDLKGKPVNITLRTKSHELMEVEVTANAPHIAFDNPVRSVLDYVISDDGIYLLAYRMRNTALLHLSFAMDTLHELKISSAYKNLYRNFYDFIHVLSGDNASQVGFTETSDGRKKDMFLYRPVTLSISRTLSQVEHGIGSFVYFGSTTTRRIWLWLATPWCISTTTTAKSISTTWI